jgi:5-methylcytosine-specific restriction endonuclease McrA
VIDPREQQPGGNLAASYRQRVEPASITIAAIMDGVVLVLNQNYEPLNVCNLPRAFRLILGAKAEVIEYDHQVVRTPRTEFRAPSVIRLQHLVRRPRPRVRLARREVFARDHYTCQYCGRQTNDLTLDHVVPRHRGGGHTWENLVTACKSCNHRKGGKTLEEARMRLIRQPFEPRSDVYSLFTPYLADSRNEAWRTYLFLGRS